LAEKNNWYNNIFSNIRFRDRREEKRSTGFNFFREDSVYGSNSSYIQGWNTKPGDIDISGLGNGQSNSIVVSCLQILGISFSEAILKVTTNDVDGTKIDLPNHPFSILMRRPNPYMSGDILQQYIINAMHVSGDAYLLKQKNEIGELVALYPLLPEQVTPKGTKEDLITHYVYELEDGKVRLEKEDVVHLRLGLNPKDHKKGFSPLKTVLREIFGDESAGQMATALLANMGVPSVMITPKDEFGPTAEEAEQISRTYQQKVAGRNKGKPLVMSGAMNVEKLSFSPKDLDMGLLRQVPEERVSAVLGVPAILAGLGAGLKHATYSNAKELREFFTENKLIPLWRMVAEELTQQILLPDYLELDNTQAEYDFSEVRALQTDMNEIYERLNIGVQGGWITVAEARQAVGLPSTEEQHVYLLPMGVNVVGETLTPEVVEEQGLETSDYSFEDKIIKKIDDEYCIIAEDSGKNMGCYPTRELAIRRLRQIEAFSNNQKKNNKPIEDIYTLTVDGERVHNSWLEEE